MAERMRRMAWLTCLLVLLGSSPGCGQERKTPEEPTVEAAPVEDSVSGRRTQKEATEKAVSGRRMPSGEAEPQARRASRSSQVTEGGLPKGFPAAILPLHPKGEIERATLEEGDALLIQRVPLPRDEVLAHYQRLFLGEGWTEESWVEVAGRKFGGYHGEKGKISVTLKATPEGGTRVTLSLSRD